MAQAGSLPLGARSTERRRPGRRNADQRRFVLAALVPTALILLIFWIYPLANGLWGSFTNWQAFSPDRAFVGIDNYRKLADDPIFVESLVNTFQYALLYVPLSIVLALLLALAVEASGVLRGLYRTVYFLPVVTSIIATALIWKWLYQPSLGLFNQMLDLAGLPTQRWLLSPTQALPSIALYSLWKDVGFTMVLFLAGLNAIDRSFYEAAKVDGAGRGQLFFQITLPLLRPTMVFVVITGIISTLQVFGPIFIMSSVGANSPPGGPSNSTMVVAVYQWIAAFSQLNLGYGMAMGIALFAIILVVTLAQSRFLRQSWEY